MTIREFNAAVVAKVKESQTFRSAYHERVYCIEAGRHFGFEAWFKDDCSVVCLSDTPHGAFSDLVG